MKMKKHHKIVNKSDVDNVRYNTYILLIFIAFNMLITAVFMLATR
jgi:hypothetical protein